MVPQFDRTMAPPMMTKGFYLMEFYSCPGLSCFLSLFIRINVISFLFVCLLKCICYLLLLQYIRLYFCIFGDSSESIERRCLGDFVDIFTDHVDDSSQKHRLLEAGEESFAQVIHYCIRTCPRNGLSAIGMTKRKLNSGLQHLMKIDLRS